MVLMAWAPASVAAFTAATSPTTTAVTRAFPTWVIGPASSTFAALSIASVPSTRATSPRVPPVRIVRPTHGRDGRATTRYLMEEREALWLRLVRAAFIGGLIPFQNA